MKEYMFEIAYMFLGMFIGFLIFMLSHVIYPDWYHNDSSFAEVQWRPKSIQTDLPAGQLGAEIKYGYLLITKTSDQIGPLSKNPNLRYSGNNLSCNNCHLNAGRTIGSGSFVGVSNRFPQFRGRENKMGTLEERINGCMERSMNGRAFPEGSKEMKAMITYMNWLSNDVPPEIEKLYKGYVPIQIPDFKADPEIGKNLYDLHCKLCHMENGSGMRFPGEEFTGYIYPPIGGDDTFNDGAGMNRVLTASFSSLKEICPLAPPMMLQLLPMKKPITWLLS